MGNGLVWDYYPDCQLLYEIKSDGKTAYLVIKLNGSLDWGICQECGKTILLPCQIGKNGYRNLCCKMNKKCEGEIYPLIFLPHEEKVNSIYEELQNRTKEILKQAGKVTIIGYSFPFYDSDIINLFKKFTNSNAVVEIVDYEEDDGKRERKEREILGIVKPIFPNSKKIKISLDGFQGYMNQLRCIPCMKEEPELSERRRL